MTLQIDSYRLDRLFFALADPIRRDLLNRLAGRDLTAGELAEPFDVSRPAVSRHLRVLRDAGLVTVRVDGRERWFSLDSNGVTDAESWLTELRDQWRVSLFSLKSFVEEGEVE
jgi:DNA-binding transcriptional ArsR family regulator